MNNNQNTEGTAPEEMQEKTFTQEQVNAIVGKRLAEQKLQHESALAEKEKELNKREMSLKAKELLAEHGMSKELASVLKYDNEEELLQAINAIKDVVQESKGSRKIIDVMRLPTGTHEEVRDPIADAFKQKGI